MDTQLARALFAPGRLEKSPCTEELLHTVSVMSGETGFLCHWGCQVQVFSWRKARHCFENYLYGVNLYLHIGIFWVPRVLVLMVLFTAPIRKKKKSSVWEEKSSVIILQLQEAQKKKKRIINKNNSNQNLKYVRQMTKIMRTVNMVSPNPLIWKSHELPILSAEKTLS